MRTRCLSYFYICCAGTTFYRWWNWRLALGSQERPVRLPHWLFRPLFRFQRAGSRLNCNRFRTTVSEPDDPIYQRIICTLGAKVESTHKVEKFNSYLHFSSVLFLMELSTTTAGSSLIGKSQNVSLFFAFLQ